MGEGGSTLAFNKTFGSLDLASASTPISLKTMFVQYYFHGMGIASHLDYRNLAASAEDLVQQPLASIDVTGIAALQTLTLTSSADGAVMGADATVSLRPGLYDATYTGLTKITFTETGQPSHVLSFSGLGTSKLWLPPFAPTSEVEVDLTGATAPWRF